jgi:hypothetical protein
MLAPVAASAALFCGYLLIKYLPDLSLQALFDSYFWLLGTVAVAGALAPPMRTLVSRRAGAARVLYGCKGRVLRWEGARCRSTGWLTGRGYWGLRLVWVGRWG